MIFAKIRWDHLACVFFSKSGVFVQQSWDVLRGHYAKRWLFIRILAYFITKVFDPLALVASEHGLELTWIHQ